MAGDELDELFWVKPEDFTELRSRLAAAAKDRGDSAGAKKITGTRRPTTAAWVVNRLALSNREVKAQLTDLGERLRAAHTAMDGDRIRELSAEQRGRIHDFARAAFEAAELTDPSGAMRDDVTDTLQAAIADPDVAARIGRLAKAERWSGFGEFGDAAPVFAAGGGKATAQPNQARDEPAKDGPRCDDLEATRQRRQEARAAVAAAERAKSEADDALSERKQELASARLRHDEAVRALREAERWMNAAEDSYGKAKRASRDAAELVRKAKAQLKRQ